MMLNIKALGPVVADKKIFSHFPYIGLCKTCDHQGYNFKKLGRDPLGDATYQISRL